MEKQPDGVPLLIDLDGSLADYHMSMKKGLDSLRGPEEPDVDWASYGREVPAHIEARMGLIKKQPGFWSSLERIEDGFRFLELVQSVGGITPSVLTKGPWKTIGAWSEKVEWCRKHVPKVSVTVTQDKGAVYGRGLFDDFPPYILSWLEWRKRGTCFMLDQTWNREFEHPQVVRVPRPFVGEEVVGPVREALVRMRDRC